MRNLLHTFFMIVLFPLAAFAAISPVVDMENAFSVPVIRTSADGSVICAAGSDGTVRTVEASSGRQIIPPVKLPAGISDMAVAGNRLFIASDRLYLLSGAALSPVDPLKATAVAADRGGSFGVAAHGVSLSYFQLESGRPIMSFRTPSEIYALAADSASQLVYAAGKDGVIRSYTMAGGKLMNETDMKIGTIHALAVSSDSVIAGGMNGVSILKNGGVRHLSRHTDSVKSVAVTPNGRFALTGGDDGVPIVWDLASSRINNAPVEPKLPVTAVAVDPYFRYLATAGAATGDMGGLMTIQYTANRAEIRKVYLFRDATLTVNLVGYADGFGPFGKYISYEEGSRKYSFDEVSQTVHRPERLAYAMPVPSVAQAVPASTSGQEAVKIDTAPPVIAVNERGFAPVAEDNVRRIEGTITDESGVAWAKADGKPLALGPDGSFVIEVAEGTEGSLIISAADVYGNTSEKVIRLLPVNKNGNANGRKIALLIGVNQYKHLPSLKTPEYDVRTVGEVLKVKYGYEVRMVIGAAATRDAILTEINTLRRTLKANDKFLLYYAGHGYLDESTGNAYWQPYDAGNDDDTRWVLTAQIVSALAAYAPGEILVIADSCFSGSVGGVIDGAKKKTIIYISSGGEEPVSDIGRDGHSVFTGALITALKETPANSKALFDRLRQLMPGAKQTPQYKTLVGGEYSFQ